MAKRLTPIERAIAGESHDRRTRWRNALPSKGLTRVTVIVPVADVDRVKALGRELRVAAAAPDASLNDD